MGAIRPTIVRRCWRGLKARPSRHGPSRNAWSTFGLITLRCRRTRPRREFGINENLAREILELHTLGVNGGYSQHDVTSFAQIITGWSIGGGKGRLAGGTPGRFYFRDNLHERYLAGELVVFNAAASPYRDRSHFDGQNVLESMASPQSGVRTAAVDRVSGITHMAATLMRSDGGPEVAVIEAGGWDTHANQGGAKGALAQRLAGLDSALRVLADELGPLWPKTAVLVVTEFGRTAAMNGTRGTDHGTGGCAFLVGGAVHGGRVMADWPGLAPAALLDNRDLRPTLDLRSVFKAVLDEHMHVDAKTLATRIFPDSSGARPLQGLMRA